ncbi:MAG: hypothetical protein Q8Q76_01100 [Methylotenera sp.]|nr:hypothetical protein [Methylotenera sp.]
MSTRINQVKVQILSMKEHVYMRSDFNDLGNRTLVNRALKSLVAECKLFHASQGIYVKTNTKISLEKLGYIIRKRLGKNPNRIIVIGRSTIHVSKTITLKNSHTHLDQIKLRMAKAVVEQFSVEYIRKESLENLAHWRSIGSWCSANTEWEDIMRHGQDETIIYLMTSEDEEPANRLRQSPPFVGLLSQDQVDELCNFKEPNLRS